MKITTVANFIRNLPTWAKWSIGIYLALALLASIVMGIIDASKTTEDTPDAPTADAAPTRKITQAHEARGYCWAYLAQQPLANIKRERDIVEATLINNQGVMEWRYKGLATFTGTEGAQSATYRCHLNERGVLLLFEWE